MGILKKLNTLFDGAIPYFLGDRYYGQDLIRDHHYLQDRLGLVLKDVKGGVCPIVISGGVISQGTGDTLNITACIGYHKLSVEIPDSFATLPPTKMNADIDAIRVSSTQQTDMAIASATLDGVTRNYVKVAYTETNGNTRTRAKKTGTYAYEIIPSFTITVNAVAPTDYEVCLGSFVGSTGGSFTISATGRNSAPLATLEGRNAFQVYTDKWTGGYTYDMDISRGGLRVGAGEIVVAGETISSFAEQSPAITGLTAGHWHIIYCDNVGAISVEEMTDTTYTAFPETELNSKAPVYLTGISRYKAGDATKRAIALAYSLPTPSAWDSGTTYVRKDKVTYNGKCYVAIQGSTNYLPDSYPLYWVEMGDSGTLFYPKVYNLPIETFGTGELGDVTLDGTGLGATATPLYGLDEAEEYHFENLTINGTCYCGNINGASCKPTVIRVRGTLTIGASGQLNGTERGINGGAGGAGGWGATGSGGSGGAGGKSGRPIFIYANRIINNRTSGNWLISVGGAGGIGGSDSGGGGGGGGGFGSCSGLFLLTNSDQITGIEYNIYPANIAGGGGAGGAGGGFSGGGAGGVGGVGGNGTYGGGGGGAGGSGGGAGGGGGVGGGGAGGAGGVGTHQWGSGGGGGAGFHSSGNNARSGGAGAPCAGGGGGGKGTSATDGQPGQSCVLDFPLNYVIIIPSYSSRRAV